MQPEIYISITKNIFCESKLSAVIFFGGEGVVQPLDIFIFSCTKLKVKKGGGGIIESCVTLAQNSFGCTHVLHPINIIDFEK